MILVNMIAPTPPVKTTSMGKPPEMHSSYNCLTSFWIDKPAIFAPMFYPELMAYKIKVDAWPLHSIWRDSSPLPAVPTSDTPQKLKAARKCAADETVGILRRGKYPNSRGEEVDISRDIQQAVSSSQCYSPEHKFEDVKVTRRYATMDVEVINECTLRACRDMYMKYGEEVGCLTFASGKNPGGAFLGGSDGQEESIARSSAYYHCVIKDPSLYEFNRLNKDPFQSDHLIVVPHMPVFRNDCAPYSLCDPWYLTSISAPAVNASLVRERNIVDAEQRIGQRMRVRVRRILLAAYQHNVRNLVLGEYGCGSLGNDPNVIAAFFREELMLPNSPFNGAFEHVIFAIHDASNTAAGGGRLRAKCMPAFSEEICAPGRKLLCTPGEVPRYIAC